MVPKSLANRSNELLSERDCFDKYLDEFGDRIGKNNCESKNGYLIVADAAQPNNHALCTRRVFIKLIAGRLERTENICSGFTKRTALSGGLVASCGGQFGKVIWTRRASRTVPRLADGSNVKTRCPLPPITQSTKRKCDYPAPCHHKHINMDRRKKPTKQTQQEIAADLNARLF